MIQTLELAALALPVSDREFDEVQLRGLTEIGNRENRAEDRLQPDVLALGRQQVHLQEAVVGLPLHLDEIWNSYRGFDT
jgi:hypothetical protein